MLPADVVLTDITALINQLERERDALLDIVKKDGICRYCKHNDLCTKQFPYCAECEKTDCVCYTCENICNWQWCGVPQEVKPDEQIQT